MMFFAVIRVNRIHRCLRAVQASTQEEAKAIASALVSANNRLLPDTYILESVYRRPPRSIVVTQETVEVLKNLAETHHA